MKKLFFFTLAILLVGNVSMYGQFQVVHDTGISPGATRTIVTSDNGMISVQRVDSVHLFRKYDAQGQLLWNKVLQDTVPGNISTNIAIIRNNTGGCFFAKFAGAIILPPMFPGEPPDSAWTYFNVIELDANGDVNMSLQVEKFHHLMGYVGSHSLELASQPDGTIFLLVNYGGALGGDAIELYSFQANGTLNWGRSIGLQSWPGTNPTVPYAMYPAAKMIADAQGNIYLTEREDSYGGQLYLSKISPNGDLLWMNRYNYTSGSAMFDGLSVDGNGKIHGGGGLTSAVGDFAFFTIISEEGELEKADIYRIAYNLQSALQHGDLGLDDDGRRYYKANFWQNAVSGPIEKQLIVQADTSGSHALLKRRNDQVILPNNVFVPLIDMDVHGDRMALTARLYHEHVDLAFTTQYETAMLLDTDDLFSCVFIDTSLAHIPVPLELFTTTQPSDAASITISDFVDVYPMTAYTVSDAATEPLEILCTFAYNLLGGQVGVEETSSVGMSLVQQTLIPRGSPLVLVHPDVARVELFNSTGQLLMQALIVPGDMSITGTDHSYGVHLLRAFDRNGSLIGVQRVMIE